jgi:hypothetical protein
MAYQEQQDCADENEPAEAGELEELLAAVLEWHTTNATGE